MSRGLWFSAGFVGAFDKFAFVEAGVGADEGDELGAVHDTPSGLG